jgi:hypothetical protein
VGNFWIKEQDDTFFVEESTSDITNKMWEFFARSSQSEDILDKISEGKVYLVTETDILEAEEFNNNINIRILQDLTK